MLSVERWADADITAGSEPAVSISGLEAARREEEVPLLASEWLRQLPKQRETTRELRGCGRTCYFVACTNSNEVGAEKMVLCLFVARLRLDQDKQITWHHSHSQ